ncbi:protein of unknown function [Pseudomonas sp. JV551A1]|nr:protein of unknown function [Pseudomonas sp. JV551A1]
MGREAAPGIFAAELKIWGRCAPHRDTRPLLQGDQAAMAHKPLPDKLTVVEIWLGQSFAYTATYVRPHCFAPALRQMAFRNRTLSAARCLR